MKENTTPVVIQRKDYSPPSFWIDSTTLQFELAEEATLVTNTMILKRNPDVGNAVLELDGVDLELVSVSLDGNELDSSRYEIDQAQLKMADLPELCALAVVTRIYPADNTALEGLYLSSGNYCTQCEAEGFRKITYYLDRPDVLAKFSVRIEADRERYPVLLSNGNRVDEGMLDDGRHFVQWQDPYPKPSYLFALVAGKLEALHDNIQTLSGRHVDLVIYVEAHNLHKCAYAMDALKRSMFWDEKRYRLAYDLDVFMIVAVDDFNMGAMENKGLNIFNSRYVLADQQTATDSDFMDVEGVIAHEYFHNWTGNRVTCRDWFQLSLKEGLTVFRDQQFSADMNSRAVKRIEDVRLLRLRQFPEDAGPMAHPVRPDEYMEINNFYTVTVYEKGAEVIRMMHTLLGPKLYHKGIDLYFERFDGTAATCDDFVKAMEDASGVKLSQFRNWYSQAGTPVLNISTEYHEADDEYHIKVTQSCPPTPGQKEKLPFHIPLRMALLAPDGEHLPLTLDPATEPQRTELILDVTQPTATFVFYQVAVKPVPSLLRNFSAPVILNASFSNAELAFLMANDSDDFNRWEAGQRLCKRVIESIADGSSKGVDDAAHADFFRAYQNMLEGPLQDPALVAEALALPGIEAVAETHEIMHVDKLHAAIKAIKRSLAEKNRVTLNRIIEDVAEGPVFSVHSAAIGKRSLRNACLALLGVLDESDWEELVYRQFTDASNMTDCISALRILSDSYSELRGPALDQFYAQWSGDKLVTDKWFSLQALSERQDTVDQVRVLTAHSAFDSGNPNRLRSLIGAFAQGNTLRFHGADGAGYQLLADYVLKLDKRNPQIAARLVGPLGRWQKMDTQRRQLMLEQLTRIAEKESLSPDVYEIVNKSLETGDPDHPMHS